MSKTSLRKKELINYLFCVESFRGVEALYECRGVTYEKRVARSTSQHASHSQPDIGRALRGEPSVSDT